MLNKVMRNIVGEKPWYESWTVVGLVVWQLAGSISSTLCSPDLGVQIIPESWCATIEAVLAGVGQILTVLGIRRAQQRAISK